MSHQLRASSARMRIASVLFGSAVCAPLVGAGGAAAPGWPGFRGPNGSGVTESTLPEALDLDSHLLWKREIDKGYSSPVIVGNLVVLTAHGDGTSFTLALNRATGEPMWKTEAPTPLPAKRGTPNSPVSSTPATDGERLYVLYEHFGLVCYDLAGKEVWKREMAPFNVPHGMSSSPVLAAGLVIVQCDQDTNSHVVALDALTGEPRWRANRPGFAHSYATPAIARPKDGPEQVIVAGSFETVSYDVKTGEKLWWVSGMAWQTKTVPVLDDDHSHVFIHAAFGALSEFGAPKLSGTWEQSLAARDKDADGQLTVEEFEFPALKELWFLYDLDNDTFMDESEWNMALKRQTATGGVFAVRLGGEGDVTDSHVEWTYTNRRGMPDMPSPLLYDGVLYLIKDGGLLTALNPETGDVLKQDRTGSTDAYAASPVAAGGRLVVAGRGGAVKLLRAGSDWELLSEVQVEGDIWSTPAIADSRLYVRTQQALYCFR